MAPALASKARRDGRRVPGWAPVALVVVAAALYFYFWAERTGTAQFDERQYLWLARWIDVDFPGAMFNFSEYFRGLQRLEVWMLAVPLALLPGPDALLAGRALNAGWFASTAIPVFLLARGLGVPNPWAWITGALSIAVPWAVVTTGFLTENLALPAFAWFVYAAWRTLVEGGPRRDALAVLAIVVAGLARTSLLLLAVALPTAAAVHSLRCASGPPVARLRALLARHAVLWAAVGLALAAMVLSAAGVLPPVRKLGGNYSGAYGSDVGLIVRRVGFFLSRLAVGTGFLPLGLAVAWGARQLVRPGDAGGHAFALVAAASALCVLVPTAGFTVGNPAVFEERYLVCLAPLPFLGAAAALARRDLPGWSAALGTLLVAALVGAADWKLAPYPYDPFINPAMRFYATDLQVGGRWTVPLLVAIAGVAVAWSLHALRGRRRAWVLGGAVAAVAVLQLAGLQSTMRAFADGPGERDGPGPGVRGWIDRAIHGRGRALIFGEGIANNPEYIPVWAEVQFWNTSVVGTASSLGPGSIFTPPGDINVHVAIDQHTGELVTPRPLTRYLVTGLRDAIGLRARLVATASYVPARLIEPAQPPRATFALIDLHNDGWMSAGESATLRLFGRGLVGGGRQCVALDLEAPPDSRGGRTSVEMNGGRQVVVLTPGATRRIGLRLPADALARDAIDATLDSRVTGVLPDGRAVGPKITVVSVGRC